MDRNGQTQADRSGQRRTLADRKETGTRYLIDAPDGTIVSVPEEKLAAWRPEKTGGLTPAEKRLKDRIVAEVYRSKE